MTIWKSRDSGGRQIVLEKSYKGPDGKWATTNRFYESDWLVVIALTKEATVWLLTR